MKKAAIIIYAGTETHEAMGRVTNALVMASELKENGHEVDIIFDGAGTEWVPRLGDESSKMHGLYEQVKDKVVGICEFCANAFDVMDGMPEDAPLDGEYDGHPSLAKYVENDWQIITF